MYVDPFLDSGGFMFTAAGALSAIFWYVLIIMVAKALYARRVRLDRAERLEKMLMDAEVPDLQTAMEKIEGARLIEKGSHQADFQGLFEAHPPRPLSDASTFFLIVGGALFVFGIAVFLSSMP